MLTAAEARKKLEDNKERLDHLVAERLKNDLEFLDHQVNFAIVEGKTSIEVKCCDLDSTIIKNIRNALEKLGYVTDFVTKEEFKVYKGKIKGDTLFISWEHE